jgi:anhydro-N-acetylmuramic acid kinase
MLVAGVMSGTSADGIDVALVRILGRGSSTRLKLLAHSHSNYPRPVRQAVLAAMNAPAASVSDLARLNFVLGELYAEAVLSAMRESRTRGLELIGCHGQTLYHQGAAAPFLGRRVSTTWQTGEGAVIAARCGVPVVSDFRPADMAAGGGGAPLVPLLDYMLFRHHRRARVLQNLGGIANFSYIPPRAKPGEVVAFDSGPANMVIDQCCERLFGHAYDRNGTLAARGWVVEPALRAALSHRFFALKPPKTAGREEFGREFVTWFLKQCGPRADGHDVLATATALTARSIGNALRGVLPRPAKAAGKPALKGDYIVSGGGAKNPTLLAMLRDEVEPLGFRLRTMEEMGVPSEAKEAMAFALLAHQTWHRRPGNVPSATGAKREAVLGKLSYP